MSDAFPHSATYSPQDDKIRLYFAYRISKEEWNRLKALGFTWTMKQKEAGGCDMVATWSVSRENAALELAGEIDDEDQPREERAAQRAERFERYQEKREGEAHALAGRYESGSTLHGHQNAARAERAAARHDRIGGKAVTQWQKAEYWQRRTAGVIAHALYQERADVRHRRIKGIEAEIRKIEADYKPSQVLEGVEYVRQYCGESDVKAGHDAVGIFGQGRAKHARSFKKDPAGFIMCEHGQRWLDHLNMRLNYEKQMLAAQGGTAADLEIVAGFFYGKKFQVQKVTKDRNGSISKVYFKDLSSGFLVPYKAEKLDMALFRAPSPEEAAKFSKLKKEGKVGEGKRAPLINPTRESAQALVDHWNAEFKAHDAKSGRNYGGVNDVCEVLEMTGAQWTAHSKCGDFYSTREYTASGEECTRWDKVKREADFRIRTRFSISRARHIVILTDKPQTALTLKLTKPEAVAV